MANSPRFYRPATKVQQENADQAQAYLDAIAAVGVQNNADIELIRHLQAVAILVIRAHADEPAEIVRHR
jgi:phosphoribosylanthranilate isomerase